MLPIDPAVYVKCQPFRAPNSRHATTGLYKVRLSVEQLREWTIERIQEYAQQPHPFKWKMPVDSVRPNLAEQKGAGQLLRMVWEKTAAAESQPPATSYPEAGGPADGRTALNALTMDFLRGGADHGDRHRLLFSAAANLAEFASLEALAEALLMPSALDCGLKPAEARRQILLGLRHGGKGARE